MVNRVTGKGRKKRGRQGTGEGRKKRGRQGDRRRERGEGRVGKQRGEGRIKRGNEEGRVRVKMTRCRKGERKGVSGEERKKSGRDGKM